MCLSECVGDLLGFYTRDTVDYVSLPLAEPKCVCGYAFNLGLNYSLGIGLCLAHGLFPSSDLCVSVGY